MAFFFSSKQIIQSHLVLYDDTPCFRSGANIAIKTKFSNNNRDKLSKSRKILMI